MKILMKSSLVAALVMSLVGCGGGGGSSDSPTVTPPVVNPPVVTPPVVVPPVIDPPVVTPPVVVPPVVTLPTFPVTSPIFADNTQIPFISVCKNVGGENLTPSLTWKDYPAGTTSFAMIMEMQGVTVADAARWEVFNIPSTVNFINIGEDLVKDYGAMVGINAYGFRVYDGPCRKQNDYYKFKVYALKSTMPHLFPSEESHTQASFEAKYSTHILGSGVLTARYR